MKAVSSVALLAWLCLEWLSRSVQGNAIFCSDPDMCNSLSSKDKKEYLRFGRDATEDELDKRADPFLRFGKRQDPFLRFGRNDPFLRFGKRQDPFLRFGRGDPFLRFGRNDPFLRFGKRGDPFLRFGKRGDLFPRFGKRGDPFLRFGREYMRFGRNDPFLRFGKSLDVQQELEDTLRQSEENEQVIARRKRSADTASAGADNSLLRAQRDLADHEVADEGDVAAHNGPFMRFGRGRGGYTIFGKRVPEEGADQYDQQGEMLDLYEDDSPQKRQYMRFGRAVRTDSLTAAQDNSQ
uniref:FMRFamide n=1 Tax=Onchidium reevesii TaxID=2547651 RepID=A0A8K1P7K9_9EUPU|nr:FMRFamide [Onchidium reevesii]